MTVRVPSAGLQWPATSRPIRRPHSRSGTGTFCADVSAAALSLGAAAALHAVLNAAGDQSSARAVLVSLCLFGAALLMLAQQGHYVRRVPRWTVLRDLVAISAAGLLAECLVVAARAPADRLDTLAAAWIVFPGLVLLFRRAARHALSAAGLWEVRVVVVGTGERVDHATRALLSEPALGYRIAGVVGPRSLDDPAGPGVWRAQMEHHRSELLVLAPHPGDELGPALEALVRERVPFAVVPPPDRLPVHGLWRTSFLGSDTVLFTYRDNRAQTAARCLKLAFDVAAATVLLLVLAPVLVVIAALVMLDGGPVLYRHTRIGMGGRAFPCLKFRSMVPDGDVVLRQALARDPAVAREWRDTRKLRSDPRITRVGGYLRRTSLDELPQLLNVLRLEMSLVGPRPIVEAEIARYGADIAYYFETRPGLTGLWQVSGRSDTGYEQRVRLDTWYVKNWTIWHDLTILMKTIPAVLQRRGAV